MNQSAFPHTPALAENIVESATPSVSAAVQAALAVVKRGADELLIESDFIRKLVRSESTGTPLRVKLGLDPTAPDLHRARLL